jgi:cation diffusion facilitator CzcD-associated flavoprotein CzcO
MENKPAKHVVIIGAGFGGIGLAIRLKQAGIEDFIILERAGGVGGVWRDNTYPGAACDVQSRFYSYSFEQDWPWSSSFAPQPEILAYIEHCAKKYDIFRHIRFNTKVAGAHFDAATGLWTAQTETGETFQSRMLVSAVGLFNRAALPAIPGLETFEGPTFHSSKWNHGFDLAGKSVAVIGTGASAIQFVPAIAPKAGKLYVVQRSPQYVMPKLRDRAPQDRRWYHDTGLFRRYERFKVYWTLERGVPRRSSPKMTAAAEKLFLAHIENQIPDQDLRRRLTPQYRFGCKRVLMSNDWYPALQKPNVELVDKAVVEIMPDGFRTSDGAVRKVDAIILNTGFATTEYIVPMKIAGLGGIDLNATWNGRPEAYLGMAVKGFPNFFMMYGPNTNGAASIIYLLECQARYIAGAAKRLLRNRDVYMRLNDDVQTAYNAMLQGRLTRTVVAHESCHSYFKTDTGDIVTQWPGFMLEYRMKTAFPQMRDFTIERAMEKQT